MGFPIRTSTDRRLIGTYPWLIAAFRVLHRFSLPRHPPLALCSLGSFLQRCSCSLWNSQGAAQRTPGPGLLPRRNRRSEGRNKPPDRGTHGVSGPRRRIRTHDKQRAGTQRSRGAELDSDHDLLAPPRTHDNIAPEGRHRDRPEQRVAPSKRNSKSPAVPAGTGP